MPIISLSSISLNSCHHASSSLKILFQHRDTLLSLLSEEQVNALLDVQLVLDEALNQSQDMLSSPEDDVITSKFMYLIVFLDLY